MSDVLEENLLRDLLESPFLSLIADESNDLSVNKYLILYVKYLKKHEACVSFLKLSKLDTADTDGIFRVIRANIQEKKLSPLKIVMFTSDGAEVMLGKYRGVQAKLKVS